jgi:hypothetical protein
MEGSMMRRAAVVWAALAAALSLGSLPMAATAQTVVEGLTFTTTYDGSDVGRHLAPQAAVGVTSVQFYRGNSEFDLAGLGSARGAVELSFKLASALDDRGFDSVGQPIPPVDPISGELSVGTYRGDNLASRFDFRPVTTGTVAVMDTAGLLRGTQIRLDVTGAFNDAVSRGDPSLGFWLLATGPSFMGFSRHTTVLTFDDFRLTINDAPAMPAPEPQTWALMLAGLAAVGAAARRRRPGGRSR